MRQLSKIIFIHSANIPYAEVAVDGNVHFSGTQGVGKSTILRAILFFYNADPSRLGIRVQGQKKFDQFYLPHSNSYIVYEVERGGEEGPFCVIVSRQNSRAVYRFADGPFQKEWLIDEEGIVTGDLLEVRRRVQRSGTDISNIITSYTDYRDILYGNRHSKLQHSLDRYHLMRSTRYDNLPRIITNVFLNERVDADFIKETIIQSMGDGEPSVRLKFYAEKLRNLAEIFHDTRLWTQTTRRGESDTLVKARRVIERGNEILANQSYVRELCGQLNYAFQDAEKRIPGLKTEREQLYTRLGKLTEKSDALAKSHEKERNEVTMKLGVVGENIRKAEEARKRYEEAGIDEKIRLDAERPSLEGERQHLLSSIALLEQKAGDVAARFDRLTEDHRNAHLAFRRDAEQKAVENQGKLNEELAALRKETDAELERLDETHQIKEETAAARKETLADETHRLELRINETRHTKLYASEQEALEKQLATLAAEEKELMRTEEAISNRIEAITSAIENDRLRIEEDFRPEISRTERAIDDLLREHEREEELLRSAKGSFIEWLDENVEGWSETIGRVADEKVVLYNTELSPVMTSEATDSLFGVKIDLSGLNRNVRTPNDIRGRLDELKEKTDALRAELKEKTELKEKEISKSRTRRMAELNEARREKDAVRGRLMTLPQRTNRAKDDLNALLRKAEEEKQQALAKLTVEKEQAARQLKDAQDAIAALKEERRNARKEAERKRSEKEHTLRTRTEEANRRLEESVAEHQKATDGEIIKLQEAKTEALKKEGVDTGILQSWRNKLAETEKTLAEIERNRDLIVEYRKEKREYIDREGEFRVERDSLLARQGEMDETFRQKAEKLAQEIGECKGAQDAIKSRIEGLNEDIAETRRFLSSPGCPPYLREMPPLATSESCRTIIRNIRDYSDSIRSGMEQLKKDITLFKQPFLQPVPFNFPTKLDTDNDWLRYASSVREFVENDKIRDFQTTSNGLYKNILGLISREYSTLAEREAEIRKVVNEVNSDFAKKSFAGVIRRIELRLDKSESPVIVTLQNIHDFWSRHGMEIGEANLFSSDERDAANLEAVDWLKRLSEILEENKNIDEIRLTDNFSLKMKIEENDNSTGWIDNMKNVGSDGTDILVKAIINILLINVFKKRIGKRGEKFALHCMMDEIGKLAEENIKGIVDFANARDIYIANSAPKVHSPLSYRRIYMLSKDARANTSVHPILAINH